MLTNVEVGDVAGISGVEWDAVELPSQFMEVSGSVSRVARSEERSDELRYTALKRSGPDILESSLRSLSVVSTY